MRGQQPVEALQDWLRDTNGINRQHRGHASRRQLFQSRNETRSPDSNKRTKFAFAPRFADHARKIAMTDTLLDNGIAGQW